MLILKKQNIKKIVIPHSHYNCRTEITEKNYWHFCQYGSATGLIETRYFFIKLVSRKLNMIDSYGILSHKNPLHKHITTYSNLINNSDYTRQPEHYLLIIVVASTCYKLYFIKLFKYIYTFHSEWFDILSLPDIGHVTANKYSVRGFCHFEFRFNRRAQKLL